MIKVVEVFRPSAGGIKEHILALAGGLDRRLFQVILAGPMEGDWPERARVLGLECLPLRISAAVNPYEDATGIRALARLLGEIAPDVVHFHGAKAALVGRPAAYLARIPGAVYTVHGFWSRPVLGFLTERMLSPMTTRYVAVSQALAAATSGLAGIPAERIRVIHNGVDLNRFRPGECGQSLRAELGIPSEVPVVGTVARLSREKGVDLLLQAARRLSRAIPDMHILIVGDGPEGPGLQRLAVTLGLGERVTFAGYRTDVDRVLKAMDLYVQPSRSEGLGISALEAAASGLAVVATGVGGLPEAVDHGQTGLLVEPGNAAGLALAILTLLGDSEVRARMGEKGRRLVEGQFSLDGMLARTAALYVETFRQGRRRW